MKSNKYLKPIIALVLVGTMAIGGSLAYITANTDEISNEFVFAHSGSEGEILSVDLTEEFLGTDGEVATESQDGAIRTAKFLPGDTLTKQAQVSLPTNELSSGAKVYIRVDTSAMTDNFDISEFVVDSSVWEKIDGYEDLYKKIVDAPAGPMEAIDVFSSTEILVSSDIDISATITDKIIIDAFAIQAANISDADAITEAAVALGATATV